MKNIEIDETFELAFRFVTETNENIFLTGKAGTGKTTFLRYLKDNCTKNIVVTAPTGVAAINAGGVTLHSLFRLPLHPFLPTEYGKNDLLQKLRYRKNKLDLLRKMDLLVVDEISMVRADVLDAVDTILKSVRKNPNEPFGGVQVLFIGDLYQLPPVARNEEWMVLQEFYNSEFFFDSQVLKEEKPLVIELKKVFRQQDTDFISLLNKVRNNQMEDEDFQILYQRYIPGFIPEYEDHFITLTSHNAQADRKNEAALYALPAQELTYEAEVKGIFPENSYPAEINLRLKVGAQVMFLKNDTEKRFYNGKIGIIKYLDEKKVIVSSEDEDIEVSMESWDNTQYSVDGAEGKLNQRVVGTFKQYPLRLAWAITIHKSQGLTFDQVMIEASLAFSSGQVYVALSRCTSMDGIVLLSKIPPSAILCNSAVVAFSEHTTSSSFLATRFQGARQVFTHQLLESIFSLEGLYNQIQNLDMRVVQYSNKLNKEAIANLQEIKTPLTNAMSIAQKFIDVIGEYLKEQPVIEENHKLQKRISDGANHFLPILNGILKELSNHAFTTEHKEVSDIIDPLVNEIYTSLDMSVYALAYCKTPFSVTGFLKHKLAYFVPRKRIYTYGTHQTYTKNINHQELFSSLKNWRDEICQRTGQPIYTVANKDSLLEIAQYLPQNETDLQRIKGFGAIKAQKYGPEIIDMINEYCQRTGAQSNIHLLKGKETRKASPNNTSDSKKPANKIPSPDISLNLYKEGKSIAEIAKERGLAETSIEGHLSSFIKEGGIKIDDFVSKEIQSKIKEAAATHGWDSLKVLKDNLPDSVSYGQIKMTKNSL